MKRLENKITIITGAGSGIGRRAAQIFSQEGAKIVVADLADEGGNETVRLIQEAGGEAVYIHTDVSQGASVKHMVDQTLRIFGRIDVLFNNAGVQGNTHMDCAHMPEEVMQKFLDVNVKGVWNCIHYAADALVKSKGVIVNTASFAASTGGLGGSGYGMSKGAVRTLTFAVSNELGMYGVRCNCISPYTALTDRIKSFFPEEWIQNTESRTQIFSMIDVDCIAKTALFLASDDACSITGIDLRIDGGALTKGQPKPIDAWQQGNPYPML